MCSRAWALLDETSPIIIVYMYWQVSSIREQVVTMISLLFSIKALPVGGRACTHLCAEYTAA